MQRDIIGCALRRSELVGLTVADLQQRDGRAVFVDIAGKGGRIRTVPVPDWVEATLQAWLQTAGITKGRIFRAVSGDQATDVWPGGISNS